MKLNQQFKTLLPLVAFAVVTTSASAAISYVKVTNDVDSGISSTNTYTHALDLDTSGTVPTINGVLFTQVTNSGANFTRTLSAGAGYNNLHPL